MEKARAEAKKAAEDELNEKKAKHEKRLRDRAMFREQAKRQNEKRALQRAAEDAEEKREVDAARASLEREERKNAKEKEVNKKEQERLRLEIIAERKLKEERKQAEWRENARIDAQAREAQDETERRKEATKAKRDARIEKFASMHARGAGQQQADAAAADDARVKEYLKMQAKKVEARHRSDLAKIADTNAKIKAENDRQMARKRADAAAAAAANNNHDARASHQRGLHALAQSRHDGRRVVRAAGAAVDRRAAHRRHGRPAGPGPRAALQIRGGSRGDLHPAASRGRGDQGRLGLGGPPAQDRRDARVGQGLGREAGRGGGAVRREPEEGRGSDAAASAADHVRVRDGAPAGEGPDGLRLRPPRRAARQEGGRLGHGAVRAHGAARRAIVRPRRVGRQGPRFIVALGRRGAPEAGAEAARAFKAPVRRHGGVRLRGVARVCGERGAAAGAAD
mmetsp:Transcript_1884/g.5691  ORF Transcript_1884/g.5691 Transcript_1884/m.5691 type:complete len:454 (-) Transcript_1884:110-1471(-)